MTRTNGGKEAYLAAFARFEKELAGDGMAWTAPLRSEAIARFEALGFPTLQDEAWRHTSVAPIARTRFALAPGRTRAGITPETLQALTFEPWDCSHMVFVNGRFAPDLSRVRPLPGGVVALSLAEALASRRDRLEPHLARHADPAANAFVALNTAFMRDGVFLEIPPGRVLEEPFHLLFVSTPEGDPGMAHPRNLIVAGARSQAKVVECYVGLGRGGYLTNAVTEIVAEDGAIVDHYKLQRESLDAYHVATLQARVGRGATFASHSIALGGALVRNDVNALLGDEGGECTLNGLYVVAGRQHVDNHTSIDHARPHCTSRELYKGVLDGQSRGVFEGRITVRPDAQKTDARQTNKNLLISEDALVDTEPALRIEADDVKCTHGATIGQIDEDALFYLRSRGVGREAARNLLIHAFVNDLLDRVAIDPLRAGLECLLATQLPRHGAREAL